MKFRLFASFALLCFRVCFVDSASTQAQTTLSISIPNRGVYWLHDINEDIPKQGAAATTESRFWQLYAGRAGSIASVPNVNNCGITDGLFFTERYMLPKLLNFYSDRYIPDATKSLYGIPGFQRSVIGGAKSLSQVADSLSTVMPIYTPQGGSSLAPIAIAQGAGSLMLREVERLQGTTRFGSVIGIGSPYTGKELVNSADNGVLQGFENYMIDELDAGQIASNSQFVANFLSGVLGLVPNFLSFDDDKIEKRVGAIVSSILTGGSIVNLPIPPWSIQSYGQTFPSVLYSDFTKYVKGAYTSQQRPMLSDMVPGSPFLQNLTTYSAISTLPVINISGEADQSFFRVSADARPSAHPEVRCLGTGSNDYNQGIDLANFFKSLQHQETVAAHIAIVAEQVFFTVVGFLVGGVDPLGVIGAVSSGWSIATGWRQLDDEYRRGEEWLDHGANSYWAVVIGAYSDINGSVTRWVRPRCDVNDPLCDPTPYQATFTYTFRLLEENDGIVGRTTQTATPNVDVLVAKDADHFAQGNHPASKATFDLIFDNNNPKFRLTRKK